MGGLGEDAIGGLIDRVQAAALQPQLWREVLQEIATAFSATGGLLIPVPGILLSPSCSAELDEAVLRGLKEGWFAANPRTERCIPAFRDPDRIVTESMLFTPRELDTIPYFAEFMEEEGLRWFMGIPLTPEIALSIERRSVDEPFGRQEVEVARRLLPHLRRAAEVARRFGDARAEGQMDAFDALGHAAILIDRAGGVVRANARAEALFGPVFRLDGGAIRAADRAQDAALRALLASLTGPVLPAAAPGPLALRRAGARPVVLHGMPLPRSDWEVMASARAILLVIDPDAGRLPGEAALRAAFGLTPTEARVAQALAAGRDAAAIAADGGWTEGTVRFRIKSILGKTGTRRQGELVALLLRMVPPDFR